MALRQLSGLLARTCGWPCTQSTALQQCGLLSLHTGHTFVAAADSSTAAARNQPGASTSHSSSHGGSSALPLHGPQLQQARGFASGGRGLVPSRKPAIKKPARHQWHYCAPDYDPMLPKPSNPLPPYAPPRAHLKDYKAAFRAQMPQHHRNRCAPHSSQGSRALGRCHGP